MKEATFSLTSQTNSAEAIFKPIDPPTLKNKIIAEVRAAILTGKLPPGTRIVEARLAKQMNVAQTTVREALQEMESQGFLIKHVNRETLVRKFNIGDLEKLFRLRLDLEGLAVELAHPNSDEESLRPLYGVVEEMRRAATKLYVPEFYRLDIHFHQQLWALSRNEFLLRAMNSLSVGPVAFVLAGLKAPLQGNYAEVADDHVDILDTLKKNTPRQARLVMEEKLRGWQRMQVRGLQSEKRRRPGETP